MVARLYDHKMAIFKPYLENFFSSLFFISQNVEVDAI